MSSTTEAAIKAALVECGVDVGAADVFAGSIAAHAKNAPPVLEPPSVLPGPGGDGQDNGTALERTQLRSMTPEAIEKARRAGLLDHLLRGDR